VAVGVIGSLMVLSPSDPALKAFYDPNLGTAEHAQRTRTMMRKRNASHIRLHHHLLKDIHILRSMKRKRLREIALQSSGYRTKAEPEGNHSSHIFRSMKRERLRGEASHSFTHERRAQTHEGKTTHIFRSMKRERLRNKASHHSKPSPLEGEHNHIFRSMKRKRLQEEALSSSKHSTVAKLPEGEHAHTLRSMKRERLQEEASHASKQGEKARRPEGERTHIFRSVKRERLQAEALHASERKIYPPEHESIKMEDVRMMVLPFFGVVAILGFALQAQYFLKKLFVLSGVRLNLGAKEKV